MRRCLVLEVRQLRLEWSLHRKNHQASIKLTQDRNPPSRTRAEHNKQEKNDEIRDET